MKMSVARHRGAGVATKLEGESTCWGAHLALGMLVQDENLT